MGCSNNSYQYESDAETLFSVGRRFLNGDCVEKDVAKAKEILTKAAELGHPMASKLLERIKAEEPATEADDMTEWNKMRSGELYDWTNPVIDRSLKHSRLACERFNKLGIDHDGYREALEDLIPGVPKSVTILPPFHCDHGNGLHLGEGVFVNYNGMTAEQFVWAWLRSEMLEPKQIKFEPVNIYYEALKDAIDEREKEVSKHND